jgi:PKD repeat protein
MRRMRSTGGRTPFRPGQTARHDRRGRRGQSLVEFALIVPLLLFLTVIALDFGRVYLGWINLQSMTRIAANLAANNPTAWSDGNAEVLATYQNQIRNDAAATNCALPTAGGVPVAPSPVFSDASGNGAVDDIGDNASVAISCTFDLITPGIKNIFGGTITVSASSVFPVTTGMTASGGTGPSGDPPAAAFSGNGTLAPSTLSGVAPFTVTFRDTSGGNPTSWLWEFQDGSPDSTLQDPLDHTFVLPGTYLVKMTATNVLGSSNETMGITVVAPSTVDFTSGTPNGTAPLTVTFVDNSTPGGTTYTWNFGSGEGTATGTTASHTYTTPGDYTVSLTVDYPGIGPVTTTRTNYVSVGVGLCTVPHLDGVKRNNAPGVWLTAGFTGTVSDGVGAPSGNYTIVRQSITALSKAPCNSNVVVNN